MKDTRDYIERNGRCYRYDADFDVYRPAVPDESGVIRWAWLAVVLVLTAVCYGLSL
jgi:hypothetical protein